MEAKGKVNQYETKPVSKMSPLNPNEKIQVATLSVQVKRLFTLNLATGTTPFIVLENGEEHYSNFYRVMVPNVTITHVWYRPDRGEFETLDREMQDYVLNGGLLRAPLGHSTLTDDPTEPKTDYEVFQNWCLATYGRRLGPEPNYRIDHDTSSMGNSDLLNKMKKESTNRPANMTLVNELVDKMKKEFDK